MTQTLCRCQRLWHGAKVIVKSASQLVCIIYIGVKFYPALSLSFCSHPLTRAALPPVPTGVHETPGARCAMVTRYLQMLEDISGMS